MDVREYFKKKNGEPMDEKYEDLLTVKEVLDIAQECVNEALKQAKNNESLHLVSSSFLCGRNRVYCDEKCSTQCEECKEEYSNES